jgi:hypothetical protein
MVQQQLLHCCDLQNMIVTERHNAKQTTDRYSVKMQKCSKRNKNLMIQHTSSGPNLNQEL